MVARVLLSSLALLAMGCGSDPASPGGFTYSGEREGAGAFELQMTFWQQTSGRTISRNIAALDDVSHEILTIELSIIGEPMTGSFANVEGDASCGGRLEDADSGQIWFAEINPLAPSDCTYRIDEVVMVSEEMGAGGLMRTYDLRGSFRVVLEPGMGATGTIAVTGEL